MCAGDAAIGSEGNSRSVEGAEPSGRVARATLRHQRSLRLPTRTHGRRLRRAQSRMAGFGSLPLRRHAPTLGLLGDAQDLARGRGLARYGRAEAEVVEDAADGEGVGHEGDDAHALAAAGAGEWIHLVDLRNQPRPAW